MKGIILAGGSGTRLSPMTTAVCKQLLPVYDKPMIFYPLSTLMLAGLRDILIIGRPDDLPGFRALFGDGSTLGLRLEYAAQDAPDGVAQALTIGREFLDGQGCCLILGDNIFFGNGLPQLLRECVTDAPGARVLAYKVPDPERYGVITFDQDFKVLELEEKPANPTSSWAATGVYFFDQHAPDIAAGLKPSARGEYEITDVVADYLARDVLSATPMGRGYAWLDAGTPESLIESAQFVRTLEKRQGMKIGCPEEIAFRQGWIDHTALQRLAEIYGKGDYATYLRGLEL